MGKFKDMTNYKFNGCTVLKRAENNPGVSRYLDLVNYIDRLERR